MSKRLSIIIGALREEKRLGKTLRNLNKYLVDVELLEDTELILVIADGGDKTYEVATKYSSLYPHIKIIQPGKPVGKGRDIKLGMEAASSNVNLYMDADLATPLHHIEDTLHLIENNAADIVIGVRDIKKMHNTKSRFIISLLGNICFSLVAGKYLPDTQCGFKAFNKKTKKICFSRLSRLEWSFDMELLIIAQHHNMRIAQLPIYDWTDVPNGTFRGGVKSSLMFLKDLLVMLFNRITKRYS